MWRGGQQPEEMVKDGVGTIARVRVLWKPPRASSSFELPCRRFQPGRVQLLLSEPLQGWMRAAKRHQPCLKLLLGTGREQARAGLEIQLDLPEVPGLQGAGNQLCSSWRRRWSSVVYLQSHRSALHREAASPWQEIYRCWVCVGLGSNRQAELICLPVTFGFLGSSSTVSQEEPKERQPPPMGLASLTCAS